MPLRKRTVVDYFCPLCGYSQTQKPLSNKCPSCNEGKGYRWTKLDQARADSLEGGE
jgi:rubrerythrin